MTTFALTPIMLVFGEIIPKAIAREWATSLILRLYRPLTWASRVLVPFVARGQHDRHRGAARRSAGPGPTRASSSRARS